MKGMERDEKEAQKFASASLLPSPYEEQYCHSRPFP